VNKFRLYPNPFKESIHFEFENTGYKWLTLSNLYGRTLIEYNIEGKLSVKINKGNLPSGIYFLTIYDNQGITRTTKVIFE
jgi:hypothetical protein